MAPNASAQTAAPPAVLASPQNSISPDIPANGRPLSLAEALELANRRNLDLAAARLRRAFTLGGILTARQFPNPTITFGAARDIPHENLLLEETLELGGKRGRRMELARQENALVDLDIHVLERDVRRKVRTAYYTAALARQRTEQLQAALGLTERLDEIAKTRFEAGDIPQLEVLQADLEVARARANVEVSRQQERIGFTELNGLLNEPPDVARDLSDALDVLPAGAPLGELTRRAAQANAELQRIAQETKIEQSRLALLRAARIPDLGIQAGVDLNAPPDYRVGLRGQVSVVVPLFARNQGAIAQSTANTSVLNAQLSAMRRAIDTRVAQAFYILQAKQTQVNLYSTALVPAARRIESLAEESYREGKANILSVVDARRNVQQIEREYLDSLFELQSAFADMELAVGESLD